MAKRRHFLKVLLVTGSGSKMEWLDSCEPENNLAMRKAQRALRRAIKRYLNVRRRETRKGQCDGPVCRTVQMSEVAASPGLRLDAEYHLDRQEREAQD